MKPIWSGWLIASFLMLLFLVLMGNTGPSAWAQVDSAGVAVDYAPGQTVPPKTPELHANDVPMAFHDELAVGHGISLTYKSKGIDPTANQLIVQARASDGAVAQIGPEAWGQISEKTFTLPQSLFVETVEVMVIASSQPISWSGDAGVWVVNATNTGVNLMAPKQAITTELSVGKASIDPVAATTTVTFTMRATPKFGAQWGDVYHTELTVYNGCPGAVWPQQLSSRDKFGLTVASAAVTSTGPVPWDMRHIDDSGLILAAGTISSPICGQAQVPPPPGPRSKHLYLPMIHR